MANFFKSLIESDPPASTIETDDPCEQCSEQLPAEKLYKVVVEVKTRAGDLALEGLTVKLDDQDLSKTGKEGKTGESKVRSDPTARIEVLYENAGAGLKREVFTLPIVNINAASKSFSAEKAKNLIEKIQDVFGSGNDGFGGDMDFEDEYPGKPLVSMKDTDDPDIKLITTQVKMATLSLAVPYQSQVGAGESIQIEPSTPAAPGGKQHRFKGTIICMPTSAKMCIDYWGITADGGGELSRNALMQKCWDTLPNPTADYPSPWQGWSHLRKTVGDLADAAHPGAYKVTSGPDGTGVASIPSDYADGITNQLAKGVPVVTSTYATSGHVMCVRGAVVGHNKKTQWLIFNDPYGNLATTDSIYDELDLTAPVGLRGNSKARQMNLPKDARAVREVLTKLGHYAGSLGGTIDETDPEDQTVKAIKAFQGGKNPDGRIDVNGRTERRLNTAINKNTRSSYSLTENEKNTASGDNADRGRHVYYSGSTEAKGAKGTHRFRLKTKSYTLAIEPETALTNEEIRGRLVDHSDAS